MLDILKSLWSWGFRDHDAPYRAMALGIIFVLLIVLLWWLLGLVLPLFWLIVIGAVAGAFVWAIAGLFTAEDYLGDHL